MAIESKKQRHRMPRTIAAAGIIAISFLFYGFVQEDDLLFKVGKGIDLFGSIYKELSYNYVDEIDPMVLMKAGITGMLSVLDPYTVYIDEQDKSDVDILTSGQYGGVGISVRRHDGRIIVTNILDVAREEAKLRIGDELLEVDGVDLIQNPDADLKILLRGKPGTGLSLKVKRPGLADEVRLSVTRQRIMLENVSYYSMLNDSTGYIKLDRFSRRAGEELRLALANLSATNTLKCLVLDIRDNPGGLLDAAVDVSEKFLPTGSLIVSTRGRKSNYDRSYYCSEEPVLRYEPLVVLVNENSASASEILAGAIQDNDRGIIVGTRSYGKGLVQNVIPLSYNSSLKITTSKYYTPSGRCIQRIDYSKHKSAYEGTVANMDTVRSFSTLLLGRNVKEAGGINPDYVVNESSGNKFLSYLIKEMIVFDFITVALNSGEISDEDISDSELKKQFVDYLESSVPDSAYEVKIAFDRLRTLAKEYGYSDSEMDKLKGLEAQFTRQTMKQVEAAWPLLNQELRSELSLRLSGEKARFQKYLPYDEQLQAALNILSSRASYLAAFNVNEH